MSTQHVTQQTQHIQQTQPSMSLGASPGRCGAAWHRDQGPGGGHARPGVLGPLPRAPQGLAGSCGACCTASFVLLCT
jgi:hypothetical protein